ncbi:MAG: TIGR00282 family metallophosphoesterase [Calditrichia bacterium]
MRILFVADLVGQAAVDLVVEVLPGLVAQHAIDCTIVNGENADKGKGITAVQLKQLKQAGVACITSGNHIWEPRKRHILEEFRGYLIRPLNYPAGNAGAGSTVFQMNSRVKVGVVNLQGKSFMSPIECPFTLGKKEVERLLKETPIVFVDFHAEATAEKQAMGYHLAGKATAVIGTHTHVQTNDPQILSGGTAYLTDAGMTGPQDSVIGMETDKAIERFIMQSHVYYKMAHGLQQLNGAVVEVNELTGKAQKIYTVNFNRKDWENDGNSH